MTSGWWARRSTPCRCAPAAASVARTICCLDKGYDYREPEAESRERGVTPHIRRRGEKPLIGCVRGKPRRWVVERTNSWHNRYRAILVRWERKAANYLALLLLACALIALQQA
jgi:IS5 family transposase